VGHPALSFRAIGFSDRPTLQAASLGSVGTPAAAPCTGRAVPSPALRLLRPHPPTAAVPAHRRCICRKRAPTQGPRNPWTLSSCIPGRARRRGRRNSTCRAAPKLQGLHCKASSVSGVFCAYQAPCCETTNHSRVSFTKCIFTSLCILAAPCKIHNKSQKNQKKCKPNFVVLSIKNAKSIHDLELDFGYVMSTSFSSKIAQSYKRNLFINIIW
jgi:hypothetical protein